MNRSAVAEHDLLPWIKLAIALVGVGVLPKRLKGPLVIASLGYVIWRRFGRDETTSSRWLVQR